MQVMEGKEFTYDEKREKEFNCPDCMTVAQALNSPIKAHISVAGILKRVCIIVQTYPLENRKM